MPIANQEEQKLVEAILAVLATEAYTPRNLILKLEQSTSGFTRNEKLIREIIWQLIDQKRIQLTVDRKLKTA